MVRAADLHVPVLRDLCVDLLRPALQNPGSVMIDATLGMGGHTEAILESIPTASVLGVDRDPDALALASKRLGRFGDRFTPVKGTFDTVEDLGKQVDAVLMDLGVSSLQLDEAERGFAYAKDGPLDMRMNQHEGQSAADLVNTADERELARILWEYGEEKMSRQIARAIVREREKTPFSRTSELVDLIDRTIPPPARRRGGNPSKRTFQALRIAVNDEIAVLERALPAMLRTLRVNGRMVVESYHSLEDRIVKRVFASGLQSTAPPGLPVIPKKDLPRLKAITKGAIKADEAESAANPRAKSVRLRGVELIRRWEET